VAVPFTVGVQGFNQSTPPVTYAGAVVVGTSEAIPTNVSSDGMISRDPTFVPQAQVTGSAGNYTISAVPFLLGNVKTTASNFYLFINGSEYSMKEVNSSYFYFNVTGPKSGMAYVYGISPGTLGGEASVYLVNPTLSTTSTTASTSGKSSLLLPYVVVLVVVILLVFFTFLGLRGYARRNRRKKSLGSSEISLLRALPGQTLVCHSLRLCLQCECPSEFASNCLILG